MIFLAWSGGLNSTYALYEALRRDMPVHAHHVRHELNHHRFFMADGVLDRAAMAEAAKARTLAEWDAVIEIRAILRKAGYDFEFSHSALDWSGNDFRLDDTYVVLAHVLNCAVGGVQRDDDRLVFGADSGDYATGTPLYDWQGIVNAHARAVSLHPPICEIYGRWASPKEQFFALPEAVRGLVMSCRRPRMIDGEWTPCGSRETYDLPGRARWEGRARPCSCAKLADFDPRKGWAA